MAKTKKKKSSYRALRFRKDDPIHNLYASVQHYVRANGGSIVVIGGVQVQEWPGAGAFSYTIGVKCQGKKPELKKETL